ncbi:Galactose-binding domain-like protein, partial [Pseudohyphozyma bogoriensis]
GIWTESMYGVGEDFAYSYGDPASPLGPSWQQDDWWFRGPGYRALKPQNGSVSQLPAGGTFNIEIACHVAWTSFGWSTTPEGYPLDACPGNSGAYHSGTPGAADIDTSMLSGCALGIADVDDISKVTMDNLVIFSVQHECVKQKHTSFEIPARMPACTGEKCICGWFWLASNGTGNFYMTAFDCKITNVGSNPGKIAAPVDPTWCAPGNSTCKTQAGAKRPLYAYNSPTNVVWVSNYDRPGYHENWSFSDGAQNDIFEGSVTTSSAASSSSSTSSPVGRPKEDPNAPKWVMNEAGELSPEYQKREVAWESPEEMGRRSVEEAMMNDLAARDLFTEFEDL